MRLQRPSPCKVNLLLNILGRRPDGFHELETVMHPIPICDILEFERRNQPGIELTCSLPELPTDSANLVWRAATQFLEAASQSGAGVRIHLEKVIPLAAGLGGGSGNAAVTLTALNDLYDHPLTQQRLHALAASLGSDVPFFLHSQPVLATGRGEAIQLLAPFAALRGAALLLIHPGFGVSTVWAYRNLSEFPAALHGQRGRAMRLVELLSQPDLAAAGASLYNALEAPVLHKYPVLALYQEFLRTQGAVAALMSGSGSTTFGVFPDESAAQAAVPEFERRFGEAGWVRVVSLTPTD